MNTLIDNYHKNVPKYYPYMYKDGFTPEQIFYAHHKQMIEQFLNSQEEKETNVKIESEIRVK